MKVLLLLLTISSVAYPMHKHHVRAPRPTIPHALDIPRLQRKVTDPIARPATPRPTSTPPRMEHQGVSLSPMSPEEVYVEEVRAHVKVVQAMSKKKIACLVAATAITSAILTATVTLTIHFTDCQK